MVSKKNNLNRGKAGLQTTVGLHQTKPAKASKIVRLQKKLEAPEASKKEKTEKQIPNSLSQSRRVQPQSQIAKLEKTLFWFLPARLAFLLNGIYILLFSLLGVFSVLANFGITVAFLTLPFEPTFTTTMLLESAASLGIVASILMFMAAIKPYKFKFLYYFMLILFLPVEFISDFARLQLQTPVVFESYLYFDIIAVSFFWITLLLSLPAYLRYPRLIRKIKLTTK